MPTLFQLPSGKRQAEKSEWEKKHSGLHLHKKINLALFVDKNIRMRQ